MNNTETPWSRMRTPALGGLSTLRVVSDLIKPWYWIKSDGGYYGVAIQLPADEGALAASIQGTAKIQIVRVDDSNGDHYLGVVINASELATVFHRLCLDLLQACNYAEGSKEVLGILKRRVSAWQRLFEKGSRKLSPEKCLGLIAELKFLTEHWVPELSATGVAGWLGPAGGPQDFKDDVCNLAVEIKAYGIESDFVKISSKEQLDYAGRLYLLAYPGALSSEEGARTLNQYVEEAKTTIPRAHYVVFEEKLIEVGYINDPYYDEMRFCIREPKVYRVEGDFPRLTSDTLPNAIGRVRYDLSLTSIVEWGCTLEDIEDEG